MMRTLLIFLLLLAGTFFSGYFGPWWAPPVFILVTCALLKMTRNQSIWMGLIAMSVVYGIMAIWHFNHDSTNLITKTGSLLGGLTPLVLVIITLIIGAVCGSLAGWVGNAIGKELFLTHRKSV